MAREFRLPDIGEGLTEAEIVSWLAAEGDQVEANQPIVEVETDKAVVEIPSPYAGVVHRHGGAEGQVIEVGAVLVVIAEEGETPESVGAAESVEAPEREAATVREREGTAVPQREAATVPTARSAVRALPVVRKLARDSGIDIETVTGTGPGRRVTREDVEAAIAAAGPAHAGVEAAPPASAAAARVGDERRAMSKLRRTIAANMSRSWAEAAHVTTFDEFDAGRLLDMRVALGERHGVEIPLEALIVKAVLPALDACPEMNATVDGDDLIVRAARDIGVAVDTPDGLLVAVTRDAAAVGLLELGAEVRRLIEGAKGRSLMPDELTGQTFTVSNIGAIGGGHGTPIIPPGNTAILSIGRAREKPVAVEGSVGIARLAPLSLSYDHRVIDGGLGRRFIDAVTESLEAPALLLADGA